MKQSESRVLTLYYHRINALENDYNMLCVSPARFRQQMLYLKNNYPIVRFEDDWSVLKNDAVAITFDDGYLDNLQYAMPVLEELQIPAMVFVSTGALEQPKEMWWDELEKLLFIGTSFPNSFSLEDDEFRYKWKTFSREMREDCYQSVHFLMKNLILRDRRDEWLRQLREWRGYGEDIHSNYQMLSEKDCVELAKSKWISIGAHTVTHPSLANLDAAAQEKEIGASVEKLSRLLQREVRFFSYPFGGKWVDYDCTTMNICRRCGIKKAASTVSALWNSSTNDFEIPRKVVRNWNLFEFEEKMKEYWDDGCK